jgi:DNA-binding FadR family transcriptional regulator
VLQARQVELDDLAGALAVIEPACAAHCAIQADRHVTLVPRLRDLNRLAREVPIEDALGAARLSAEFHNEIINGCGNATLVIVIGALERLWSLQGRVWADFSHATGGEPDRELHESVLDAHEAITDAIDAGDPALAHRMSASHLAKTQPKVLDHVESPRIHITNGESGHASASPRAPER